MSIRLFRIDDRLIHGQVVVGWGRRLGLRYYVVADDALAHEEWERELLAGGLPSGVDALFVSVDEAAEGFGELDRREGSGCLLTRGTVEMRRLAEAGCLEGRTVTVGCLGPDPGRRRTVEYVHLTPSEAEDLRAIARRSAAVEARDLPTSKPVPLRRLLRGVDDA